MIDELPQVIWFYGLSGSGKTTLSKLLYNFWVEHNPGQKIELLDGDMLRASNAYKFDYSSKERSQGLNVALSVAYYLRKNNIVCILASLLFAKKHRQFARKILPGVIDIYCNASLETCISRDPKDVYKNNISKTEPQLVGIDIAFEVPDAPMIELNTNNVSLEDSWNSLLHQLIDLNVIKSPVFHAGNRFLYPKPGEGKRAEEGV